MKDDFGAKMRYDYDCLGNVTLEERVIADGVHSVIHYAYNKTGGLFSGRRKSRATARYRPPLQDMPTMPTAT